MEVAALSVEAARLDLEGPGFPDGCEEVYKMFLDLNAARTSSGFGANPLSYREMESFSRLTGHPLAPWQVDLITAMDHAILAAMNAKKGS